MASKLYSGEGNGGLIYPEHQPLQGWGGMTVATMFVLLAASFQVIISCRCASSLLHDKGEDPGEGCCRSHRTPETGLSGEPLDCTDGSASIARIHGPLWDLPGQSHWSVSWWNRPSKIGYTVLWWNQASFQRLNLQISFSSHTRASISFLNNKECTLFFWSGLN